ncbi:MAG: hypothetical protein Q9Q13_07920, partial [Acidobacteriota bacterium]|nr:hypothetical protein [Acidobacteriota bacterium]
WCCIPWHHASADCGSITVSNPVTGNLEKVWAENDGHDYEIHWAEQVSGVWTHETTLTSNTTDDTCPGLAINGDGASAVVWRESGTNGRVYYRARQKVGSDWVWQSSAVAVSDGTADASRPWVAWETTTPWVGWHEVDGAGSIYLRAGEGPSPWPTGFTVDEVATTSFNGELAVQIHAESGHVWIDWIDSSTRLGWSEWDASSGLWGAVQHEDYSGSSQIPVARQAIRSTVLGS